MGTHRTSFENDRHFRVAVQRLRSEDSEPAYQALRDQCWGHVAGRIGHDAPDFEAILNQSIHDLMAVIFARGFSVQDIISVEWPETLASWCDPERRPEAVERSASEPREMTLAEEKRINEDRRIENVDSLFEEMGIILQGTVPEGPSPSPPAESDRAHEGRPGNTNSPELAEAKAEDAVQKVVDLTLECLRSDTARRIERMLRVAGEVAGSGLSDDPAHATEVGAALESRFLTEVYGAPYVSDRRDARRRLDADLDDLFSMIVTVSRRLADAVPASRPIYYESIARDAACQSRPGGKNTGRMVHVLTLARGRRTVPGG